MNDNKYKKLVTLLKLFKSRPYHLAKFLIDNDALSDIFIKNILNSDKISEISNNESNFISFNSIDKMEEFYSSLIDLENISSKSNEDLEKDLNLRLASLIKEEKYEDAANLRDYMKRKNIKKR
jgi:hypothetical protein